MPALQYPRGGVRLKVEGYVYLDQGISEADALAKVKAKGAKVDSGRGMLVGPKDTHWYFQAQNAAGDHYGIRVSFATGDVGPIQ